MRNYIPMTVVENHDPEWAARIRLREMTKRRRQRERYKRSNRAKYMWLNVRQEAKRKGVCFELTVEWFQQRLDAGICELSGLPFNFERREGGPSVDRRAAGGHYTADNCRMILYSLNMALNNLGEAYMVNVFKHVIARLG